jgi:hypothetical protein
MRRRPTTSITTAAYHHGFLPREQLPLVERDNAILPNARLRSHSHARIEVFNPPRVTPSYSLEHYRPFVVSRSRISREFALRLYLDVRQMLV